MSDVEDICDYLEKRAKDFFRAFPETGDEGKNNKDGKLVSKQFRDAVEPFRKMSAGEALQSPDFLKALCNYGGMSDERFNDILEEADKNRE